MNAIGNLILNGDTIRYLELGISAITNGTAAWAENKELQKTWAGNAQAIVDRAKADPNPSSVKPTPEEWAAVRDFENAAYAESQAPLTHEGPAAT